MNNDKNMFEVAIRNKFRFEFKGLQSVESLWDLTVRDLDTIFKGLNAQLKEVKEESLLDIKTKQDEELDIKIEIVKYIVKTKLEEEKAKVDAKAKREEKQKLLEALDMKNNEDIKSMSKEEILKKLAELDS
jgi:hypothetical protein